MREIFMGKHRLAKPWRSAFFCMAVIVCSCVALPGMAAEQSWTAEASLKQFAPEIDARFLNLRQADASKHLVLPIPERVRPRSMHIHLVFTNSSALLAKRSQIRLRLNGGVFAQAALDPAFPDGVMDVDVPAQLLHKGDNDLSIEVTQHSQASCEDPTSPELWTTVDLAMSTIRVEGVKEPIPLNLNQLSNILHHISWTGYRPYMVSMGKSPSHLTAGALIAEGVALRVGNTPFLPQALSPPRQIPSGRDVIIFGTVDEFNDWPAVGELPPSASGRIKILARQNDPGHFLLMIVGKSPEGLVQTAEAFAWMKMPINGSDHVDIASVQPDGSPYLAALAVEPGLQYRFSELELPTATLRGMHDMRRLRLWMPPDLISGLHTNVELHLHFSYGAGMRADSVMNIYHNGRFLRGISLGDPKGLMIQDYRITIPLSLFSPGVNEFTFEAVMRPNTGSNCTLGNTQNLLTTIFGDSTLVIPRSGHFVEMPNIKYAIRAGFPYYGDLGDDSAILLEKASVANMASAWMLAGKLAQVRGLPVKNLRVDVGTTDAANIVHLAKLKDVDVALWQKAPVDLGAKGVVNHPSLANPKALGEEPMSWRKKLRAFLDLDQFRVDDSGESVDHASIQQTFNLLNTAVWVQFENPSHPGGTYSLIVSDNEKELNKSIQSLIGLWSRMRNVNGDVLVWGKANGVKTNYPFWSARVGTNRYHIGSISYIEKASYYAIHYPAFLAMMLLAMFFVMALLTRFMLIAYRKRHHPDIGL